MGVEFLPLGTLFYFFIFFFWVHSRSQCGCRYILVSKLGMGLKLSNNKLKVVDDDLNVICDHTKQIEYNFTHLLNQVMQRMEQIEALMIASNKGSL